MRSPFNYLEYCHDKSTWHRVSGKIFPNLIFISLRLHSLYSPFLTVDASLILALYIQL